MLQVKSFTFNPFQENTYLLYNESKQCIIVDPGMYQPFEEQKLFQFIASENLTPILIANTHCHLDHVFGVHACIVQYAIPFCFHEKDQTTYDWVKKAGEKYGVPVHNTPPPNFYISEKDVLQLGNEKISIRFAPGHAPGHLIFIDETLSQAIVADVIFQQSIGRSDLPGGNLETLIQSIQQQIFTLPDTCILYSGHGPSTSVGLEKMNNPYVSNR
jgi:hydroxyacylglutathione hydrolase